MGMLKKFIYDDKLLVIFDTEKKMTIEIPIVDAAGFHVYSRRIDDIEGWAETKRRPLEHFNMELEENDGEKSKLCIIKYRDKFLVGVKDRKNYYYCIGKDKIMNVHIKDSSRVKYVKVKKFTEV